MNEQQHLTKLGIKLRQLLEEKKELEEATKNINTEIDRLQGQFVEAMQILKLKNFEISDIGKFFLHSSLYSKVVNKEILFEDLRAKDAGDLIREVVNPQTLRAYVREQLENSNTIPAGVEVFTKTVVHMRSV